MAGLCPLKGGLHIGLVSPQSRVCVPACPGLPAAAMILGSLTLMVDIVQPVRSSLLPGRCGSPLPGGFGLSER